MAIEPAALAQIPIFAELPTPDIDALRQLAQRLQVAGGEWLFRQGDEADCFYAVLSGGLDLLVTTAQGHDHLVVHMGPGAIVGETSVLIGGRRSASARATDATALLRFPDAELREMVHADSLPALRIMHRLAQALAYRLRALDAQIAQMTDERWPGTEDDLARLRRIFFTDWAATSSGSN